MISQILKRMKRAPVFAVISLLFAFSISVIIGALYKSNAAEMRNYEETWKTVPITVTLTDTTGTQTDELWPSYWVLEVFTGRRSVQVFDKETQKYVTNISLAEYMKDMQVKVSRVADRINSIEAKDLKNPIIFGISALSCEKQLLPEYGCQITWKEGYDDAVFASEELVCIIPEGRVAEYDNGKGELVMDFSSKSHTPTVEIVDGEVVLEFKETKYHNTFKIVGVYSGGDGKSIYCPYSIVAEITQTLEEELPVWSLSATLVDNTLLDEFRQKMSFCFIEPAQDADEIPWGYTLKRIGSDNKTSISASNDYYQYALDINDDNLFDLADILEDSIKFNRTVTVFVVILSVISGFLVGFLMVRRRKRDIMLMRMVGESNARVYAGFALEQMIWIILGIVIGGAYYKWNPINNLAIFAVAYFVALTLALVIFMSKKLINNVKEDE